MSPAPGEGPRGSAIFWASVLAFVVADLASFLAPRLGASLPVEQLVPVLSYVLLAGFALALAVVSGVVVTAVRAQRAPPVPDAFRAAVALALVIGHAVLIAVARGRKV